MKIVAGAWQIQLLLFWNFMEFFVKYFLSAVGWIYGCGNCRYRGLTLPDLENKDLKAAVINMSKEGNDGLNDYADWESQPRNRNYGKKKEILEPKSMLLKRKSHWVIFHFLCWYNKRPQLRGFKQQKFLLPQCWSSEAWNPFQWAKMKVPAYYDILKAWLKDIIYWYVKNLKIEYIWRRNLITAISSKEMIKDVHKDLARKENHQSTYILKITIAHQ